MSVSGEHTSNKATLTERKTEQLLVIAADRSRARLFQISENESDLVEVIDLINSSARTPDNELERDRQGRGMRGTTHGRHGRRVTFGESGSKRYLSINHFATEICATAAAHVKNIKIKQCYVIASPEFMGVLRPNFQQMQTGISITEILKNVTRRNASTIRSYLPKELWPRYVDGVKISPIGPG
ncbi:MAG: host attachment protein [Gammaproteobacteria bacterium]